MGWVKSATLTSAKRRLIARAFAGLCLTLAVMGPERGAAGDAAGLAASGLRHPQGFTGAERCAGCHEAEAAAWRASHHANAMRVANPADLKIPFRETFSQESKKDLFTPYLAAEGPRVRLQGADGNPVEMAVAATIGVSPLAQFLVPSSGGRYQVLPFAWDARAKQDGGQRWFDLYPAAAHDPGLHWTSYNQTWNSMCASCHTTGLDKGYDPATKSYRTTWSDFSVACGACHGAGAKHVAWAEAGGPKPVGAKGFDKPSTAVSEGYWGDFDHRGIRRWTGGDRTGEIDRCAACHARRRSLVKDAEAPGKPLLDTHSLALLDDGLYFPDGQIKDEVFEIGSFLQSRMYREHVICNDCHDPHRGTLKAPGNAVCGQCHDPKRFDVASHHHHAQDTAAAQCTTCHMPQRTYMGVHARHDHSFRLPAPQRSEALNAPDPCLTCHGDRGSGWAEAALNRWAGGQHRVGSMFANALAAGRTQASGAREDLISVATDPAQPGIARGTALALLGAFPGQATIAALQAGIADEDPLLRLGAVRGAASYQGADLAALLGPALRDPVRAVRIEAGRLMAPFARERGAGEDDAIRQALDAWIQSELLAAERPETHLNLGVLFADLGDAEKAEASFKEALALDPKFSSAALNLADLYRSLRREAESETVLRRTVALAPDDGDAHYALALLLVRGKQLSQAVSEFETAAALKPDDPRVRYALALAVAGSGDRARARTLLDEAHRRFPDDRDLLQALAEQTRQLGDFARALEYADALERLDRARQSGERK